MTTDTSASWLFVPGDRPDRFAKAAGSAADEVIYDLEDAVAADRKELARLEVARWLSDGGSGWVRVNAGDPWFDADVAAMAQLPGLRGVIVPKAESAAALQELAGRLPEVPIIALIETARGVHDATAIAGCGPVVRLAFGAIDFAQDIDVAEDDYDALLLARSTLVLASRVARLPAPIDGVCVDVRDPSRVARQTLAARRLGFGGKLCIHPAQVAVVAENMAPQPDEIVWASTIIAALDGDGVCSVNGQMVDKPVIDRARRILTVVAR